MELPRYQVEKFVDLLRVTVHFTISPCSEEVLTELTHEEILERCTQIVNQAANLSVFEYSEADIEKFSFLYFLNIITDRINDLEEYEDICEACESYVSDELDMPQVEQYVNEELRMFLLRIYQDYRCYAQKEESMLHHLTIAKTMISLRREVSELFYGLE